MTISLPIQGNGFVLREFHQSDAKNLADIEFDPDVKRFLAVPAKAKDKWTEELRSLGIRGWVIQVDGQTAGCASLGRAKRKGDGELRIVIGRAFWGQALGTKVASLLIQIAFEQLAAKTIIGVVHPENKASLRLLHLFRFRRRGVVQDPEPLWQRGHLIYRLTRKAYSTSVAGKSNGGEQLVPPHMKN